MGWYQRSCSRDLRLAPHFNNSVQFKTVVNRCGTRGAAATTAANQSAAAPGRMSPTRTIAQNGRASEAPRGRTQTRVELTTVARGLPVRNPDSPRDDGIAKARLSWLTMSDTHRAIEPVAAGCCAAIGRYSEGDSQYSHLISV